MFALQWRLPAGLHLGVGRREQASGEAMEDHNGYSAEDNDDHHQLHLLHIREMAAPLPSQQAQESATQCLPYLHGNSGCQSCRR